MRSANNGYTKVAPDGCHSFSFYIGSDDNFKTYSGNYSFVTIGKMDGLGGVTKIPSSGWANKVAVKESTGYVGRYVNWRGDYPNYLYDTVYVRIYVTDYIVNTSGGIIGANVKYQSPFNPR